MTASVSVITNVNNNALAVPLDAVQLDSTGEYVNKVANGAATRIGVRSGQLQGDVVVVTVTTGELHSGDAVQLIQARAATTGGPGFGGPAGPGR
jgi:multidrug efflux pump subunit AcrA (membrane-fusion protein)